MTMAKDYTKEDFKLFAKSKGLLSQTMENRIENYVTPVVLEERSMHVQAMDIFSRMLLDRVVYFTGEVEEEACNTAIAQLLYLNSLETRDISMYLYSPGGGVVAGLGLIDTMNYISCDVSTTCVGMAASMGAVILSNGAKGKRFVLPHSRVMIHQVSSGMQGKAEDLEVEMEQTLRCKKELYDILSKNTGKSFEQIEKDCKKDFWLIGNEAVEYGLADIVLDKERT